MEFFKLVHLKQGLKLQAQGIQMSSRLPRATTIARRQYGLKGNLESLTRQVEAMVEAAITSKGD
tara:strand:- start:2191 stop:2382 length:192 start_codon:yes stop_codon:yes gene_type:complete